MESVPFSECCPSMSPSTIEEVKILLLTELRSGAKEQVVLKNMFAKIYVNSVLCRKFACWVQWIIKFSKLNCTLEGYTFKTSCFVSK